jgi:hypothetical protein
MNDPGWSAASPATGVATERVQKLRAEWVIALIIGLVHLAVAGRYDIFRNELYFIVCGLHPDFGFVDQPPFVPLLAAATQIFGDNPWLLRLPAVLAAAGLVLLTAYFLSRAVILEERRALLWAGLIAGVAMEAKYGIVFWLVPLGIGVVLTSARRILAWPTLWLGVF